MSAHATFSPSGAHRWMACPASIFESSKLPAGDTSSVFSDEGTAAHHLAALCLEQNHGASRYQGKNIHVLRGRCEFVKTPTSEGRVFAVDQDMCRYVQEYLDQVRGAQAQVEGTLYVERRVDFAQKIGTTDNAFGTADAVVISGDGKEIQVHDLKYGQGVRVDARDNEQLMLYALGALDEYDLLGEFETVSMYIHQPRLGHMSFWQCSVTELMQFAEKASYAASTASTILAEGYALAEDYTPGEKQCRFCNAKATCPALRAHVLAMVSGDFVDESKPAVEELGPAVEALREADTERLANCMSAVDLIEDWCKAVRVAVHARLEQGTDVPGFKLVAGRKGARAWADADLAKDLMSSCMLRDTEMFSIELISPTAAEKLHKAGRIPAYLWERLTEVTKRSDGKPTVAPLNDKRSAINVADDFDKLGGAV